MISSFECEVLTSWESAEKLIPSWAALWHRCPNATTFQRPEWLWSWMETFRPSASAIVVIRKDEQLVALAPLLIYPEANHHVLGLMGGGVSDYLDVLIDPNFAHDAVHALWKQVSQIAQWDKLWLSDLPHSSTLVTHTAMHSNKRKHDTCPILDLPNDPRAELRAVVPKRQLRNWRNALARLKRDGGGSLEVANAYTLSSMIEEMFDLHSARWAEQGQPGVLSARAVQQFHLRAAQRLLNSGVLRLYALRHRRRCVAFLYAFFEKETVYCYLQAFDPALKRLSLGTQILGIVIEDALRLGKKRVDFLRGREAYKYSWGATDTPTYALAASRREVVQQTDLFKAVA